VDADDTGSSRGRTLGFIQGSRTSPIAGASASGQPEADESHSPSRLSMNPDTAAAFKRSSSNLPGLSLHPSPSPTSTHSSPSPTFTASSTTSKVYVDATYKVDFDLLAPPCDNFIPQQGNPLQFFCNNRVTTSQPSSTSTHGQAVAPISTSTHGRAIAPMSTLLEDSSKGVSR